MKITKWLGLSTAISNYASPTGSAVEQTNLQLVLPGQATPRPALKSLVNKQDGSFIFGLYRKTNGLAEPDTVLSYFRTQFPTDYYIGATSSETVTEGDGSTAAGYTLRSLATVAGGEDYYPAFCEDRHGNVYVFLGHGIRPRVVESRTLTVLENGIDAPKQAPVVTASGSGQFVERIDVLTGGGSYWAPPSIAIESPSGTFIRQARARAIVENGLVVGVEMLDHGTGYTRAPKVTAVAGKKGSGFAAKCKIETSLSQFGHSTYRFFDPERSGDTAGTELATPADNPASSFASIASNLDGFERRLIGDGSGEASYTGTLSADGTATHRVTTQTPFPHMTNDLVTCTFTQADQPTVVETLRILAVQKADGDYSFDIAPSLLTGHTAATVTFEFAAASHTHAAVGSTVQAAKFAVDELVATAFLHPDDVGKRLFNGTYITGVDFDTNTLTLSHWTTTGEQSLRFQNSGAFTALSPGQYLQVQEWDNDGDADTPTVESVFAYRVLPQDAVLNDDKFEGAAELTGGSGSGATAFMQFDAIDDSFGAAIAQTSNTIDLFADNDYYNGAYVNYGVQAHPSQFKWGWQNRVSDHRSWGQYDGWTYRAYFPDYRYITYWVHSGPEGEYSQPNWNPFAALVQVDDEGPYVDVAVSPSRLADGTAYELLPGRSWPVVRLRLAYAPASWDRTWSGRWIGAPQPGNFGSPDDIGTQIWRRGIGGSGESYALSPASSPQWWANKEGNTARPIVNVVSATVLQQGTGYPADAKYRLRVCMAHANAEFNVANVPAGSNPPRIVAVNHQPVAFDNYFFDLELANTVPLTGSSGRTLGDVSQTQILNPGVGYLQSEASVARLMQRSKAGSSYKFSRYFSYSVRQLTENQTLDSIGSVTVVAEGDNYYSPPTLFETPSPGYGLKATPVVNANGQIVAVTIDSLRKGSGYEDGREPFLVTSDEDATLTAVMRPVMQGTYRCTYRYADMSRTVVGTGTLTAAANVKEATLTWSGNNPLDFVLDATGLPPGVRIAAVNTQDGNTYTVQLSNAPTVDYDGEVTVRDMTQPVLYSNFSPITDLDCGPTALRASTGEIVWSISPQNIPPRVDRVELLRTSGDQSLVFYRLQAYGDIVNNTVVVRGKDTLNDEELFDTSRSNYAAVPIVLPNGNLNAYRFGIARDDTSICCSFQDRLWYSGSTSGKAVNTVFFSEYDEFESCPPENEIPIQNNQRVTDYVTALVPYGSLLLVMQSAHTYQLTYNTDPTLDAAVNLVANRGCINNRSWDLFDDVLYAVDERGVYAMQRSGQVAELSDAIADVFVEGQIDFTKSALCHLKIDKKKRLLRVFLPSPEAGTAPDISYCFSLTYKTWWKENYPVELTCATTYKRWDTNREEPLYGTSDGTLRVFDGRTELPHRSIRTVTLLDGGSGYTEPPTVTAGGGIGGKLRAVIRDGVVTEIEVLDRGFSYGTVLASDDFATDIAVSISAPGTLGGLRAAALAFAFPPAYVETESPLQEHLSVGWAFKTPNMELLSDATVKGGSQQIDRSISVTYAPTAGQSILVLKHFYNNSASPRQNVMPRDRGTGFTHIADSTRTELDMDANRVPLGHATGVAQAKFGNRAYSDLGGVDRHLAIELTQAQQVVSPDQPAPVPTLYSYEINGVIVRDE